MRNKILIVNRRMIEDVRNAIMDITFQFKWLDVFKLMLYVRLIIQLMVIVSLVLLDIL